jgi:hypothetical protein
MGAKKAMRIGDPIRSLNFIKEKKGAPRTRPFHCTSVGLTPAIATKGGDSSTQFMSVVVSVRANPST